MKPKDYMEFLGWCVGAKMAHSEWRVGQTIFNCLYELRPDLSEQIRGTTLDCFYNDGNWSGLATQATLKWIEEHWDDLPVED